MDFKQLIFIRNVIIKMRQYVLFNLKMVELLEDIRIKHGNQMLNGLKEKGELFYSHLIKTQSINAY